MKKMTMWMFCALFAMCSCLFVDPTDVLAQWVHSSEGYSYRDDATGEKLTGWQTIGGEMYYFDNRGIAVTGWCVIKNNTYYFSTSQKGKMIKGKVKINGTSYDFGDDGKLRSQGYTTISEVPNTAQSSASPKSKDSGTKTTTSSKKKNPAQWPDGLKYGMSLSAVKKMMKGYDYETKRSGSTTTLTYTSGTSIYMIFVNDDIGYYIDVVLHYGYDQTQAAALTTLTALTGLALDEDTDWVPCCTIYNDLGFGYFNKQTQLVCYIMYGEIDGNYFISVTKIPLKLSAIKTSSDAEQIGTTIYDIIYDH